MRRIPADINRLLLFLVVTAGLARLLSLGLYPLMDTTEARYAEIARIMVELNDWVTPWFDYGVPFWGKPPFSFWLTAASFKLFGINEFAARLPHWLGGLLVAWLAWGLSTRRSGREALYTVALLVGSTLFFISAGAVMTDMTLVIGTTLAMRGFWLGLHGTDKERSRERWLLFAGLGIGLLAKGPIAVVLVMLPIAAWAVVTRNIVRVWRELPWIWGSLVTLAISLPWYVLAELHTPGFLNYFLVGEHWHRFVTPGWSGDLYGSAHKFPHGTIWWFMFADLLPWTLLLPAVALYWRKARTSSKSVPDDRNWHTYLLLWGLAPAVFFTAAGNILWPYVLPGFPALALWTSGWLARQPDRRLVERLLIGGVGFTLVMTLMLIVSLPITGQSEDKSAKALVGDFESRRTPDQALIVLGNKRSFSADFYSHGKAEQISDTSALTRRLIQKSEFVAIETAQVRDLPTVLAEILRPVSRHGRYTLFITDHRGSNKMNPSSRRQLDGLD